MSFQPQILLIERSRARRPSYRSVLERQGFRVTSYASSELAIRMGDPRLFNLTVVDAASMKTSGRRMARHLSVSIKNAPLILICAERTHPGQNSGASEVLVQPFTERKFLNRVRCFTLPHPAHEIVIGSIRFDPLNHTVWVGRKVIRLTPKASDLLLLLVERKGRLVQREVMMREIWQTEYTGDMRTVDVHMSWLRKAIEPDPTQPRYIKTIRGLGYRLDLPEAE